MFSTRLCFAFSKGLLVNLYPRPFCLSRNSHRYSDSRSDLSINWLKLCSFVSWAIVYHHFDDRQVTTCKMTIQGASPKIPQHGKADSAGARKLRAAKGKLLDKFEYRDLKPDCARLLVVEKPLDDDEERIVVSFKEVTFDSLGTRKRYQYEALSYHWEGGAREEGMKPIYIEKKPDVADVVVAMKASKNLQNAFYTFYVKPNLYYALRSLRKPDKRVHLWVDAICINQENRDEKSGQIARLAEIYSRAASVAIWLGDSDDPSKRAMAFVKKVIVMDKLEDLVKDKTHMNDWYDLEKLVQRTWFSRRWVIQELAFASKATVHCGTKKLPWKDVRDAISLFEKYIDEIRPLFKGSIEHDHDWYALPDIDHLGASALVKASNNIFRRNRNNTPNGTRWSKTPYEAMQSLEYLVSTLSPFRSSDPRDTVYAFNNIAKDTAPAMLSNTVLEHTHLVVPNYQKTLLEVYLDFVKWVTITTKSIDIICRHWAIPEKLERERDLFYPDLSVLPSWIQQLPNVSFQDTGGSSTHRIIGRSFVGVPGKRVYNACHGLPVQARFARDSPVSLGAMASDSAPTGSKRPNPWIDNASETSTKRRRFDNTPGAQQEEGDADTKQQRPDRNYGMHGGYQRDPEETDEQDATDEESSDSDSSESERIPILSDQFDSDWDPDTALIDRLIKDNRDDVSLYLKGLKIGEVKFRTDEIVGGVILPRALQRLRGTQSKDPDKLWKTLVAERDEHGNNPPPWTERAAEHWLPDPSPDAHINTKELLRKRQPTPVRTFLKRVQNVIWNRSFVEVTRGTTGDPLQGFGPTDVREGDIVCILFGCSVPCVLRKGLDTRAGNYYRFIGEAYLYGIMDGEEVTRRSDQEIETATEEFRLL